MRMSPPKKRIGQGAGPRRVDGALMDVRTGAAFIGCTVKTLRGYVSRRLILFRKLGGRVLLVREDIDRWARELDGCSVGEATENVRARRGYP